MSYYLEARYDSRNSFYKKAEVKELEDRKELYSYGHLVCTIYAETIKDGNAKNGESRIMIHDEVYHWDSATSLRHIKEFIHQECGLDLKKSDFSKYCVMEYSYKAKKAREAGEK